MKLRTTPSSAAALATAVIGLGGAAIALADGPKHGYAWMALVVGGIVGTFAVIFAIWGGEYVVVDVPAAVVHYRPIDPRKHVSVPASALGELTVVVHRDDVDSGRRHRAATYQLHASGLSNEILFESFKRERTEARKELIQRLVDAAAVRPVLALAHGEGTAFRSGPDVASRARDVIPDGLRLRAALEQLARDPDVDVRARAVEVRDVCAS